MRKVTLKAYILWGCWVTFTALCWGVDNSRANELQENLVQELQWLQAESVTIYTKIATKTTLDADFVPGMVTVLNGDEMERIGIRTVSEALALVPNMPNEAGGVPYSVRGISSSNLAGKIKNMIDGIPVNNNGYGGWGDGGRVSFDLPIEQIERIEVIRGPGGTVYGKWAYLGVVNIKTKKDENRVFVRSGSFDLVHAGATLSYKSEDDLFQTNVKLSSWKHGRRDLLAGPDSLHETPNESISLAPGEADDRHAYYSAILDMKYKDFSLEGMISSLKKNSYFGLFSLALPPETEDIMPRYENKLLQAGWKKSLGHDASMDIKLRWKQYTDEPWENSIYPPGYAVYDVSGNQVGPLYPDGWRIGPYYREEVVVSSVDFHWRAANHAFLYSMEYEKVVDTDHYLRQNMDHYFLPLPTMEIFSGNDSWLAPEQNREVSSAVLQDQYEINGKVMVTGGIRYDKYSDVGDMFTPRISFVYRTGENHIIKAQFAEGFRPPTFVEMYFSNNPMAQGNPDLKAEQVKTWELGYIYRIDSLVSRLILFYSELEQLITNDSRGLYNNGGGASTKGAEVEIDWRTSKQITILGNLSFSDTEDNETGQEVEGAVNWLANFNVQWRPSNTLTFSLLYKYIGETNRGFNDPRDKMDSSNIFDFTVGKDNLAMTGFSLRGGVKNIFNENIRYPSSYPGYRDDLPMPGRSCWLEIIYSF